MTAVDTNVLVRFLVADDRAQFEAAQVVFSVGPVWVAKTVLLDTTNIVVEGSSAVLQALNLTSGGLEFADAIHLTSRPPGAAFLSFDKALVRRARKAGVPSVASPAKPH